MNFIIFLCIQSFCACIHYHIFHTNLTHLLSLFFIIKYIFIFVIPVTRVMIFFFTFYNTPTKLWYFFDIFYWFICGITVQRVLPIQKLEIKMKDIFFSVYVFLYDKKWLSTRTMVIIMTKINNDSDNDYNDDR